MKKYQVIAFRTIIALILCLCFCQSALADVLTLPSGLKKIEDEAFLGDKSLDEVELPEDIEEIGEKAFAESSLKKINLPASLTSIAEDAFDDGTQFTAPRGSYAREWVDTHTIYESSPVDWFEFEENGDGTCSLVRFIGAEDNNYNVDIVIPKEDGTGRKVIEIGNSAFWNAKEYTGKLIIPNSITSIGWGAFYGCSGFTGDLIIPDSVTSIGDNAFFGCSGFNGDLILSENLSCIEYETFRDCSGFTGDLIIPDSVTAIGDNAFEMCSGFTGKLSIPDSVTTIGKFAFQECSGFTGDLIIPDSVTSLGAWAFVGCYRFNGRLKLPNGITSIGYTTFSGCSGLNGDLIIPDSVINIDAEAFANCSGFTGNLIIPNSVTSIGDNAFFCCEGFTGNLIIPNSVTSIGKSAFSWCTGFKGDLIIPSTLVDIGDYAFRYCEFNNRITVNNNPLGEDDCIKHASMVLLNSQSKSSSFNMLFGSAAGRNDIYTLTIETDKEWSISIQCDWVSVESEQVNGKGNSLIVLKVNENVTFDAMDGYICFIIGSRLVTGHIIKPAWVEGQTSTLCGQLFDLSIDKKTGNINREPLQEGTISLYTKNELGQYSNKFATTASAADGTWSIVDLTPDRSYVVKVSMTDYAFENDGLFEVYVAAGNNTMQNIYGASKDQLTELDEDEDKLKLMSYEVNAMAESIITVLDDFTVNKNSDGTYTTIKYNGKDRSVKIPQKVKVIGEGTFCDNEELEKVVIPDGITRIEADAFKGCIRLGSIVLPQSVNYIGESAFEDCFSIQRVEIAGTPSLCKKAFCGCANLTNVEVSQYIPKIGEYAFAFCSNLNSAPLSLGVKDIKENAFTYCERIKSIDVPETVESIGSSAFTFCKSLQKITIPANVTQIGSAIIVAETNKNISEIHVVKNSAACKMLTDEGWGSKLIIADDPEELIQKPEMTNGLFAEYFVYDKWFSAKPDEFMTAENKRFERVESNVDFSWKSISEDYTDKSLMGANITVYHDELEVYLFKDKGKGTKIGNNVLYVPEKFGVKLNGYLQVDLAGQKGTEVSLRLRGDNGVMMTLRMDGKALKPAEDWDAGSNNIAILPEKIIVGEIYQIEINHYTNGGDANLILEYNSLSSEDKNYAKGWKTVPGDWLYTGARQVTINGNSSIQTLYAMKMDAVNTTIEDYTKTTWKELLHDIVTSYIGDPISTELNDKFGFGDEFFSSAGETVKNIRKRILNSLGENLKDTLVNALCEALTDLLGGDIKKEEFFSKMWEVIAEELGETVSSIIPNDYKSAKTALEKYLVMGEYLQRQKQMGRANGKLEKICYLFSFGDIEHRKAAERENPEAAIAHLLNISQETDESINDMKGMLSGSKDAENLCQFANQAFNLVKDLEKDVDRAAATIQLIYQEKGMQWLKGLTQLVGENSANEATNAATFEKMLNISIRANNNEDALDFLLGSHLPYLTGKQCAQILAADQNVSLDHLLYKELLVLTMDAAKGVYKSVLK